MNVVPGPIQMYRENLANASYILARSSGRAQNVSHSLTFSEPSTLVTRARRFTRVRQKHVVALPPLPAIDVIQDFDEINKATFMELIHLWPGGLSCRLHLSCKTART